MTVIIVYEEKHWKNKIKDMSDFSDFEDEEGVDEPDMNSEEKKEEVWFVPILDFIIFVLTVAIFWFASKLSIIIL